MNVDPWLLSLLLKAKTSFLWAIELCLVNWFLAARSLPVAIAQIIPDETLGLERTRVTSRAENNTSIEGGAIRGQHLFHSFETFTVQENQRVYFNHPDSIETILSRVTGGTRSDILGTLGVNGNADLFLLNPAGIVLGPNARLDIAGSFVASTGDRFDFADGNWFSATEPNSPPLLAVNLTPGLQLGTGRSPLINDAQLVAGRDLILNGSVLDLEGQLAAGRDMVLQGDRIQIRDSALSPFIAQSSNSLTIEGNTVDIFALNHPSSVLLSGGDMVLRSPSPVIGDAHYQSGASFRVETPDAQLGMLTSPNDPIIRARGDVTFDSYSGASLHIFAGGSVTIPGKIEITESDVINGLVEAVILSDGSSITINGQIGRMLDIRAGSASAGTSISNPNVASGFAPNESLINTTSRNSADITIGTVAVPGENSLVFLTNQYEPVDNSRGNITVGQVDAISVGNDSGEIILDARDTVMVTGHINSSSDFGNSGNITILAGSILVRDGAELSSKTSGQGNSGDIVIQAQESVEFVGAGSLAISQIEAIGNGNSGDIRITTSRLSVQDGAELRTSNFSIGNAGLIEINASESATFDQGNTFSTVEENSIGDSEGIVINAPRISVTGNARLFSSMLGRGNAGNILITAEEFIRFDGQNLASCVDVGAQCGAFSQIDEEGTGVGGNIRIETPNLEVLNGASLTTGTFGRGDAGTIQIEAEEIIIANQSTLRSTVEQNARGRGGNIMINTDDLMVSGNSALLANIFGRGNTGNVLINANNRIIFDDFSTAEVRVEEDAMPIRSGSIRISTRFLDVINGSAIEVNTRGEGDGGDIDIRARETVLFDDKGTANSRVDETATGIGGDINIQSNLLLLYGDAQLLADTVGSGTAGNINLNGQQLILLRDGSSIETDADTDNSGGNIDIDSDFVFALLPEDSDIIANAVEGSGGNITITTRFISGFRLTDNPSPLTSDISASSEFGLDGTVVIDDFGIDPVQAVVELPTEFESPPLSQGCAPGIDGSGTFNNVGAGGIPTGPSDPIGSSGLWEDIEPAPQPTGSDRSHHDDDASSNSSNMLVEAEGWHWSARGQVVLLASNRMPRSGWACSLQEVFD